MLRLIYRFIFLYLAPPHKYLIENFYNKENENQAIKYIIPLF